MTRLLLIAAAAVLALAPAAAGAPAKLRQSAKLVTYGKGLYGQYCLACHGANGAGNVRPHTAGAGPLREQNVQNVVAPTLRGVGALSADFYLRTGYMPLPRLGLQPRRSRVLLTEQQIRALVAYVASLGRGPAIPKPQPAKGSLSLGLHLFTDHCAGCHQVVAEGGYVTGAVPPPLDDATATQVAEAVRIGPYVMPEFSKKAISDEQLNSIVAYVEYAKHPDDRGGWALGHVGPVPEGLVTWFFGTAALLLVCMVIGTRFRRE
jgi:ubiquinol-cytochrome c reductase cytochrome c subunit